MIRWKFTGVLWCLPRHVSQRNATEHNFYPTRRARGAERRVSAAPQETSADNRRIGETEAMLKGKNLQTSPFDRSSSRKSMQLTRNAPLWLNLCGGRRRAAAASRQAAGERGDNFRSGEKLKDHFFTHN